MDDIFDDNLVLDKLPLDKNKLQDLLHQVGSKTRYYRNQFFTEQSLFNTQKSQVGDLSIPICGDVTKIDFDKLI